MGEKPKAVFIHPVMNKGLCSLIKRMTANLLSLYGSTAAKACSRCSQLADAKHPDRQKEHTLPTHLNDQLANIEGGIINRVPWRGQIGAMPGVERSTDAMWRRKERGGGQCHRVEGHCSCSMELSPH